MTTRRRATGTERLRRDLIAVAPAWLTTRALTLAGYVLAVATSQSMIDGRTLHLENGLLAWDGRWYERIAEHGYQEEFLEGVRFFPLYPLLGRVGSVLFLGSETLALIAIANVCSLGFTVALRRLVLAETGSTTLADRSVWVSAVFPAAFVSVWAYSETLMLWAVVAGFLALRERRWRAVAVCGVIAGLSRPLGVGLAVAALPAVLAGWSAAGGRERVERLAALVAAPAAGGGYVLWASVKFDDFLIPFTIQDEIRGENPNLLGRLFRGLGDMVGSERYADGLHVPFALLFLALLVVVFVRLPLAYGLYTAVVLLAALTADTFNSLERYGLNAFPLLIALAMVTRHPRLDQPALMISAAGCAGLAALAWTGGYVP